MNNNMSIICSILKREIIIESSDASLKKFLKKIGCKRKFFKRNIWVLSYANEQQLTIYLDELRKENFLFSGGQGWPPSAVFQKLRERGLLAGTVKEVVWAKPGSKLTREV